MRQQAWRCMPGLTHTAWARRTGWRSCLLPPRRRQVAVRRREEQCAALSGVLVGLGGRCRHELGRVHWAMGSQTRLQAGEQYRVCYFRKSAGRYDMLEGHLHGVRCWGHLHLPLPPRPLQHRPRKTGCASH